ncbi:MAG: ubiquitin-conjugating enzyme E2 [Candidatus Hodarchaeota archaeon]
MVPNNELALVREAQLIYNKVSGFQPVRGMLNVWEGKFQEYPNLLIRMVLPREFPNRPPVIRIESSRPIRHPNINERTGTLRIGILTRWNSSYHAYQALIMSRELLKRIPPVYVSTPTIPTIAKKIVREVPRTLYEKTKEQVSSRPIYQSPPQTPTYQKPYKTVTPPKAIPPRTIPSRTTPPRITPPRVQQTPRPMPVPTRPTWQETTQTQKTKAEKYSEWVKRYDLPSIATLKQKLSKKDTKENRNRVLKFLYGKEGLYWKEMPKAEEEDAEFLTKYFKDLQNAIRRTAMSKISRANLLDLIEDTQEYLEKGTNKYPEDLEWADRVVFTDIPDDSWALFYNLENPVGLFFMPKDSEREKYFVAQYLKVLQFELDQAKRNKKTEEYKVTFDEVKTFIELIENIDAVEYLQWVRKQDLINIWRLVNQIQVLERSKVRLTDLTNETSDLGEFVLNGIWSIFDATRKGNIYNIQTEPEKYVFFLHYMFQLQVHLLECIRNEIIDPYLGETYLGMIEKSRGEFTLEILSGRRRVREVPVIKPRPVTITPPVAQAQVEQKEVVQEQPLTEQAEKEEIITQKESAKPVEAEKEGKTPIKEVTQEKVALKASSSEESTKEEKKKKLEEERREWEKELEAA